MSTDLEKQMAMLEGLGTEIQNTIPQNQANTNVNSGVNQSPIVETAETLRGEVPFGVQPVQQTIQQPVQQPVQQMQQPNIPYTSPVQNTPVQEVEEIPQMKQVKLGKVTNEAPIKQAKGEPGHSIRIALIDKPSYEKYVHWIDNVGFVTCTSDRDEDGRILSRHKCCQFKETKMDGKVGYKNASRKFIVPVLEYSIVPGNVNALASNQVTLKYLKLGNKEMNQIAALMEANPNITTYDLVATTANDQWKTVTFAPTGITLRTQCPNALEEESKWDELSVEAYKAISRVVPDQILQERLNQQIPVQPQYGAYTSAQLGI